MRKNHADPSRANPILEAFWAIIYLAKQMIEPKNQSGYESDELSVTPVMIEAALKTYWAMRDEPAEEIVAAICRIVLEAARPLSR